MEYFDSDFKAEVVSALFGQTVRPNSHALFGQSAQLQSYGYVEQSARRHTAELSVDGFHLSAFCGNSQAYAKDIFVGKDFFDPTFDQNFTNMSGAAASMRGDEFYQRPVGWSRIGLNVKGKYPDGDAWLGTDGWRNYSVPGEWPVCYHGTSIDGVRGIIETNYKAGHREKYGRGIYSTPDISVAEKEMYAKTFKANNGKSYKVILQNRINPAERQICRNNSWLIPVPEGASAEMERAIVSRSIRPYGILIKEIGYVRDAGAQNYADEENNASGSWCSVM